MKPLPMEDFFKLPVGSKYYVTYETDDDRPDLILEECTILKNNGKQIESDRSLSWDRDDAWEPEDNVIDNGGIAHFYEYNHESRMKQWPEKGATASFGNLVDPFVDVLNFGYKLERRRQNINIPYDGYDIGDDLKACNFSPDEKLLAENLQYDEEDQGRDLLTNTLSLVMQIGIEQGQRIHQDKEKTEIHNLDERVRTRSLYRIARCATSSLEQFGSVISPKGLSDELLEIVNSLKAIKENAEMALAFTDDEN